MIEIIIISIGMGDKKVSFEKECAAYCGKENVESLQKLECGHWIHKECLDSLLGTALDNDRAVKQPCCPLCKRSILAMRNDAHWNKIDQHIETKFNDDLQKAIQESIKTAISK